MKTLIEKIEKKKKENWLKEVTESRNITQEILKYGVSQNQIKNIIKMLALELEDLGIMKSITGILSESVNEEQTTINILKPGGKTDG